MKLGIAICILTLLIFAGFISALAQSGSEKQSFERAAYYKKNCAECHGNEADKKFNPDLPEGQMVDAILNGQQMETPPDMPAFAEKGINEARAKALITYMKALRQ